LLILARTWFAFSLPSKIGCDRGLAFRFIEGEGMGEGVKGGRGPIGLNGGGGFSPLMERRSGGGRGGGDDGDFSRRGR
jgi:hypothetical protein